MPPRRARGTASAPSTRPTSPDPTQVGETRPPTPPLLTLADTGEIPAIEPTLGETQQWLPVSTLGAHASEAEDEEDEASPDRFDAILTVLQQIQSRLTAVETHIAAPATAPPPPSSPPTLPSVFPSTSATAPPQGTTLGLAAAAAPPVTAAVVDTTTVPATASAQPTPAQTAAQLAVSPTTSEKAARVAAAKQAKAQKAQADFLTSMRQNVRQMQDPRTTQRLQREQADRQALLAKEQDDMHTALERSMADQQVRALQQRPVRFFDSAPGPSGVSGTTRTACHNSCCTAGTSSHQPAQSHRLSYSAILQQGKPAIGMSALPTHHVSVEDDPTQVETQVIDFMELARSLPAQGELDKAVRLNDLPIFKGDRGDSIQSFVQNMTNAFSRLKIPVCQWMPLVQARMRDNAESWLLGQIQIKELAGGPHLSFREFVRLATNTYGRIQPVETWVTQWMPFQQTGSTAAFIERYAEFRRRIPASMVPDCLMALRFRQMCRRDIAAEFIRIDSTLSLQDVFLTASEIDTRLGTAPQPHRQYNAMVDGTGPTELGPLSTAPAEDLTQSYQDYGASLDPAIAPEQREEMVMAFIQRKRRFAGKNFPRTSPGANQPSPPSSFQYPPKMTPAIMEWCIREQRCFRCRQTGHSSQSCPHAHRFTQPRQTRPSSGLNTLNTETPQIPVIQGTTMLPPSGPPLS
jgi:hypothetical protein